jgi:hypothetical protein
MHCPSCGADSNLEQRFCRSCGMDLETVSKLVAQHSSPEGLKHEKLLAKGSAQQRVVQSFGLGVGSLILGLALLFVLKTLEVDKTYHLIAAFFLFMGMGVMCYGLFSAARAGAMKPGKLPQPDQQGELTQTEVTKELPSARVPVPVASITERTTQLIANEDAVKRGE